MKPATQFFLISIFIAFTLNAPLQIQAQNEHLSWAGAWQFGTSGSVHLDNERNLVFLASGGAVQIVDVNDPANPAVVNEDIRTGGLVEDIWYNTGDGNLYLACGRGGFEVWDVSDYMNPARLSRMPILYFDEETPVEHVEVYNNFAVLECSWGYIHTVDISDPAAPQQIAFNGQMGNPAHDFHIDKFGYIHATGAQFYTRLLLNDDGTMTNAGGHEFIYGAYATFGLENEAYVSYSGSMYILDLTLPGFPAWSVTPVPISDIMVIDEMAFIVNQDGFEIWDVSSVQSPSFVGSVTADNANELIIEGNTAYVSARHNGLYVIDFSDPVDPQVIANTDGYGWAAATVISGQTAYVSHSLDGLLAIDISDPYDAGPELMGALPSNGETRDADIFGETAYIADWTGGFRIADVSDPFNPEELSSIDMQAWRVAVGDNNFVHVTEANPNNPDTLWVIDVSDPVNPQIEGSYTFPGSVQKLKYQNGYLYAAGWDNGLQIIDVSDPSNPAEAAVVDLPSILDVWLQGSLAYAASSDWDGGFVTIDISDPENPVILQIYNPSGWFHPFTVSVSGSYAYVGLNFGEIHLFDVSDPTNVVDMETYIMPGESIHLFANQNFLYVSDGPAGMQILQNDLITGIDEQPVTTKLSTRVYPNPARENINISIDLPGKTQLQTFFYDISGRLLYKTPADQFNTGTTRFSIPADRLGAFSSNLIIFEIRAGDITSRGKFLLLD